MGGSLVVGTAVSVSVVQYGNVLISSGAVTSLSAITNTALLNGEIQVNYSSNYDSWKANKPTSKTFGTVEGKVKGKKGNIRVDAEPHSGKVQIQSGEENQVIELMPIGEWMKLSMQQVLENGLMIFQN